MGKDSAGGDTPDETEAFLSLDAILDVLSHHQRRTLLRWLRTKPDQRVSTEELVHHLLDQEQERTGKLPSADHLEVTLHHVHQPKLSEAGLLTYNEEAETYQYHANERVEKWLDLIDAEHDDEW